MAKQDIGGFVVKKKFRICITAKDQARLIKMAAQNTTQERIEELIEKEGRLWYLSAVPANEVFALRVDPPLYQKTE